MLLGYYPLLPNLIDDLPDVLAEIRKAGCLTALDAAGDGGELGPLAPVLPHLDLYVPSFAEARHQTGEEDPRRIIAAYRDAGAAGLVGVKLGSRGVLLSPDAGRVRRSRRRGAAGRRRRHDRRRRLLSRRPARRPAARHERRRRGATRRRGRRLLRHGPRRDGGDSRLRRDGEARGLVESRRESAEHRRCSIATIAQLSPAAR